MSVKLPICILDNKVWRPSFSACYDNNNNNNHNNNNNNNNNNNDKENNDNSNNNNNNNNLYLKRVTLSNGKWKS